MCAAAVRLQRLPIIRNTISAPASSLTRRVFQTDPDMVKRKWGTASEPSLTQRIDYERLDSSRDEIRLIRLIPASPNEPVQCSIFNTPRASAPPYKALSYAWGHRIAFNPILINSRPVFVTQNLRNGLCRLRPKAGEQELVLWVDAICINQTDIPERSLQTAKMRSVYRDASSVLVFLGMESDGSAEALKFARDLLSFNKAQVTALLREESSAEYLKLLVVLFRRRYFWRIWVIQEVYYAKSAIVYCGDEEISWNSLDHVCDILAQHESHLKTILYKSPAWIHTLLRGGPRGLQLSRYSCGRSSFPPLLELLLSHKSKESTDPKDKVYALVGISSSKTSFGDIDYSLSVREIYTHTARHIISTSKKLDVICVKSHSCNDHNLPSWAPDWTRPPHKPNGINVYTVLGLQHCENKFTAAGNSEANIEFLENGYVLKATGVVISEITKVANSFRQCKPHLHETPALEVAQNWWNTFTAHKGAALPARREFGRVISCGNWKVADCERKLLALLSLFETHLTSENDDKKVQEKECTRLGLEALVSVSVVMNGRRLFISESNAVGLAPWDSREGDIVCVLLGCRFPVVLRREGERYILVGEAYVEGFMRGEALKGVGGTRIGLKTFEIH